MDMNYLFEEFIRKLLSELYESAEKKRRYLFQSNESFDGERGIEPDILLNGEVV